MAQLTIQNQRPAPNTVTAREAGAQSDRHSPDRESRGWVRALADTGPEHEAAVERLHALLLRAARFEVGRRRPAVGSGDADDFAMEAANDALVAIIDSNLGSGGDTQAVNLAQGS